MTSNIENTAVRKQREGAGEEDSIAGTKTSVEVEGRYRKNNGTSPFHATTSFHETELCHKSIHRKYKHSDTQEINNSNNNNNEISGMDNISSDINDNEEEESAEDDVENEDDNKNINNEGTNTSDEISDSKNANTAVPRPRGGTEDAYRIEGTRYSVEYEEDDVYCQGSDDHKSTNDVFAITTEEHDDTNEEAAPSILFEESHTATVKRRQQSQSFVIDELDEDESSPMGGSMENDKME
jgi:hypothetical protein